MIRPRKKAKIITKEEKIALLDNALRNLGFNEKYYIIAKESKAHQFAVANKTEFGAEKRGTPFYNYEQMNAFLIGYTKGLKKTLK